MKVRKYSTYRFTAQHDLRGVTAHPDAGQPHVHEWQVTCVFIREVDPARGFARDEYELDEDFRGRFAELEGADLSALMPFPATSENLAAWLLNLWPDLDGVRVSKCATHVVEVMR